MATRNKQTASGVSRLACHFWANTMINNREQGDGEQFFICQPLSMLSQNVLRATSPVCLSISSFSGSRSHSLPSLPALFICCLYSYRNQKHTVNPVRDAIAPCILTVRFIHSDEIREKQLSQLSAVYSERLCMETFIPVTGRCFFFFDRHLFLLRDKCQVVARLLGMRDLMCTWQTYIWEAPCPCPEKVHWAASQMHYKLALISKLTLNLCRV